MKKYKVIREMPFAKVGYIFEGDELILTHSFRFDDKSCSGIFNIKDLIRDGWIAEAPEKKTLEDKFSMLFKDPSSILVNELVKIADEHFKEEGWVKPDDYLLHLKVNHEARGYVKKSDVLEAFDRATDGFNIKQGKSWFEHIRETLENL